MRTILYNLRIMFTRYKLASILNILGLTVAFAIFILTFSIYNWEQSYNDSIKDYERIVIESDYIDPEPCFVITRPLGELIGKSSPAVESYCAVSYSDHTEKFIIDNNNYFSLSLNSVSASFINVFSLEALEGDISLSQPNSVIIPKSIADKYWKDKSPIGKTITIERTGDTKTITGVYKDFPHNTTLKNNVIENIGNMYIDNTANWSCHYYYKLKKESTIEQLTAQAQKVGNKFLHSEFEYDINSTTNIQFEHFKNLYHTQIIDDNFIRGNKNTTSILIAIALTILLIASINYINFFMALIPIRIRSINVYKVYGAPNLALRANIVSESLGIIIIAFAFSIFMVHVASDTSLAHATMASLRVSDNISTILFTLLVALALGFVIGIFPAWYITKFPPAMVLKGAFGLTKQGVKLRSILTSFQFIVSIVLISTTLFIALQNKFMKNFDYGYSQQRILTTYVSENTAKNSSTLSTELKKNAMIEDVAFSNTFISDVPSRWTRSINGEDVYFMPINANINYPQFMNLKLIKGRFFKESDKLKEYGSYIITEHLAKKHNLKIGDKTEGLNEEIVGIVKDFNTRSLKYEVGPVAVYLMGQNQQEHLRFVSIKIAPNANVKQSIKYISDVLLKLDANTDNITISTIDTNINNLYQTEKQLFQIVSLFSIVAIIISLLGLFGIVVFESQFRRKEVALRKVLGSTIGSIVVLLNRQSIRILIISTIIAIPISWYVASRWLQTFAYKIPIHWWVIACSVAIVFVVVILLVTIQTYKAAIENPIKSLKSE